MRGSNNDSSLRFEHLESRQLLASHTIEGITEIPGNKGRVSGYVFADANEDGVRSESEDGLEGWKVYIDSNGNGIHDKREKSTLTDDHGRYEFDLRPMRQSGFGHHVTVELKSGTTNTSQTRLSVLIEKGIHKSNKDFGIELRSEDSNVSATETTPTQSPYGRVSGRVFLDQDENGDKSNNEERLSGWIVYVDANRNGVRDATDPQQKTDANGRYEFERLPNEFEGFGDYVSVVLKSGFENTTRTTRSVLFEAGIHKTNKDFGVVRNNGISGFVFRDADGDRTRDSNEAKLAGWTVFIDANDNGRQDPGESFDTTNRNGKYEFKSFTPGVHRVVVAPQTQFTFNGNDTRSVTVRDGVIRSEQNFAVQLDRPRPTRTPTAATRNVAAISGRVFEDLDFNAIRSTGDRFLSNWRVFVDANRNERRDAGEVSQLTDADGRYEFVLPIGTHRIGVELRDNFASARQFRTVDTTDRVDRRQRDFAVVRAASAAFDFQPIIVQAESDVDRQAFSLSLDGRTTHLAVFGNRPTYETQNLRPRVGADNRLLDVKTELKVVDQALVDFGF